MELIILVTSITTIGWGLCVMKSGCCSLTKPIDSEKLEKLLSEWFDRKNKEL